MLIIQAKEKFLTYQEAKGNSHRTLATYEQRLTLFAEEAQVGDIADVTPEMIDSWVAAMRRRGLAAATVRNRLNDIRTFFRFCVARGYLDKSPAAHLRVPGRWSQSEIKAMAKEDFKKMLAAADHPRDVAILMFMASTGCRAGEVAGLRLADLDLEKREAMVNGKTGKRMVDFSREAAAALVDWLDIHPGSNPPGLVFIGLRSHTPVTVGTIYQMFRRLAKSAGIDGRFNPHSLRHLVGQTWCDETNLELTRQKLGHRDISTTQVYANQDRARLKEATDRIRL